MSETTYVLAPPVPTGPPPVLDAHQRAVVDHSSGPLLVLAGPGTGKTTTLVEAIVERVEGRGVPPEQVLALTFSRKAAEQLRDRVTARLGRTVETSMAATFHSFAYGLLRRYVPAELYDAPLRLLTSAEQDVVIADLLRGDALAGTSPWPAALSRAMTTRGFAREVQSVLARAREKGLDPIDLVRLGEETGDAAWRAAGAFMQQYLVILDNLQAIDYPDLVRRAVVLAEEHREELRAQYQWVFVDEYQDTDPSQVALLRVLAGDGRNLVVVGDPHQSIYGFRGAEVRGILDFPASFASPAMPGRLPAPAPVLVLPTTRRFGREVAGVAQRVAARLPLTGSIPERVRTDFLQPRVDEDAPAGQVEVTTFDTDRAEAEHIADRLRRAHLEDGIDWSDMAVLVRSGRTTIPALKRSLVAAGVPIEVAADDTPLVREPAVAPLLEALAAVVSLDEDDPDAPGYLYPDRAQALLLSPLVGLDTTDLRGLARALRGDATTASADVLRQAVVDPEALVGVEVRGAAAAARRTAAFARLLREARSRLEGGASAEEVLWVLWSGTEWPRRLREAALRGSRRAHRDLDALCALFETAARAEEQQAHTAVAEFLELLRMQEIPADTLADRGVRGSAVRLLTAHRSKGLEWRYVVIAHVQEDGWPDLRRRTSLLGADRLGVDGLHEPISTREMLAEERRLFYVALTRGRERVLATAVASSDDDGEQPSRFLAETGIGVTHVGGRPARPMSLDGIVAELRRVVADEAESVPMRQSAARRLALLAQVSLDGRALVPHADPATWWGTRGPTLSQVAVRDPGRPITLRPSTLESLRNCSLKWFLEREAGGSTLGTSAQGFGMIVHALADRMAHDELPTDPARVDEVLALVSDAWASMVFRSPWSGPREWATLREVLVRLMTWMSTDRGRRLFDTERVLDVEYSPEGCESVRLRGRADRLEYDADGRLVVVDFKTGRAPARRDEVVGHRQLALYQLMIDAGAADEPDDPGSRHRSGGAELVQLRTAQGSGRENLPKVQSQPAISDEGRDDEGHTWIERDVVEAVRVLRDEDFSATPGAWCKFCDFQQLCPAQTTSTVLS